MRLDDSRRRFVKRLGAVALVGSLAGCGGDGDDETPTDTTEEPDPTSPAPGDMTPTPTEGGTPTATATPTDEPTPTDTPTPTATPPQSPEGRANEYLAFAPNYSEGEIMDMTGQDAVTVNVGEGGNLFEPPAIQVSTGTTVTWEWIGGFHNVVADPGFYGVVSEDEAFRSGDPTSESGTTFEYTFEEESEWPYFCDPHKGQGMLGYVIVGGGESP